jgi:hypothetical protein
MNNTIKCPKCGEEIEISEAFKSQVQSEFNAEKDLELKDLKRALQEKDAKMEEFRDRELDLREKTRKLEEQEKELELTTQRRIDEEKQKIEELTLQKALEEHRMKDLEKDKKIFDMEALVEELKRKSQQGSMQTQGEVLELDLEETLRKLFPTDEITEVKKGELGGDIRQLVKTQRGTVCGLIIWESKRTKAWSEEWVTKLKEDLRRDKAHIGAIVTEAMPKEIKKGIGEKLGIWICTPEFMEPLANLLRKNLYDIAKEKSVSLNKQTKAEELYDFATSHEFVQQVERMVEIYLEMKEQVSKERATSERQWKQREMQIDRLLTGVSGIYGSIQGIAGSALPSIKQLDSGE